MPRIAPVLVLSLLLGGALGAGNPPPLREVIAQIRSMRRSNVETAYNLVQSALREKAYAEDSEEHNELLLLAADFATARSHFKPARSYAQSALEMAQRRQDRAREAAAMRLLGRVERNVGAYPAALSWLDQAERTYEQEANPVEVARCREDRALVFRRLGEHTLALELLHQARDVFVQHQAKEHLAQVSNNLGLLQMHLGLRDAAMATFQEGLRLAEAEQFRSTTGTLLENMADLLIQEGKYAEAHPLLERSLAIQHADKRWRSYSTGLTTLSQLFMKTGRIPEAERTLREALRIKEEIQETYGIVSVLTQLGICHGKQERWGEAIACLERAVRIARETRAQVQEAGALTELSRALKAQRRDAEALGALERHIELLGLIHSEENRTRLATLQNRLEAQRREAEIEVLRRTQAEREADLRRAHLLRNVILGVTALAMLLAGALYGRFRKVRQLLAALGESESRFRALAEQAPVGAWIVQDGVVQYANREVAGFFATTPERIVGEDPERLVSSRVPPSAAGPGSAEAHVTGHRLRHLEYFSGPLDLQGREATLEVFIDITRRHEVEQELARHRESLEELVAARTKELEAAHRELLMRERLSTMGRLTATVAHELRNPLGAVRSALFTLGQGLPADPETVARKALGLAERSMLRCEGMVQELLSFTATRPLVQEPTDLASWLEEVLAEYPFPEEVLLDCHVDEVLTVPVDRERLRRALVNLLENATHAVLAKGAAQGRILVELQRSGGVACLSVTDDGIGIPEDLQARVFEPLFSTKSFGSGLGLAVVREVLEGHQGQVALESQPGVGTTVRLCLPMVPWPVST